MRTYRAFFDNLEDAFFKCFIVVTPIAISVYRMIPDLWDGKCKLDYFQIKITFFFAILSSAHFFWKAYKKMTENTGRPTTLCNLVMIFCFIGAIMNFMSFVVNGNTWYLFDWISLVVGCFSVVVMLYDLFYWIKNP